MESALQVLERYEQLGIREVWLTPHVMEDIPNDTTDLKRRFKELSSAYTGPLKLHLAAEYMLDAGFERRLDSNDLLCIGSTNSKMLLVETSYFSPPMDLYGTIAHIREKGYQPLLAHPERYIYMDSGDYRRLCEDGGAFPVQHHLFDGSLWKRCMPEVLGLPCQWLVLCSWYGHPSS